MSTILNLMLRQFRDLNSLEKIESGLEDRILNQCPLKSRHINILPSEDVDNLRVVEDIYVSSEITNVS